MGSALVGRRPTSSAAAESDMGLAVAIIDGAPLAWVHKTQHAAPDCKASLH